MFLLDMAIRWMSKPSRVGYTDIRSIIGLAFFVLLEEEKAANSIKL